MAKSDFQSVKTTVRFFIGQQKRHPWLLAGMVSLHPFAIFFLRFLPTLIVASILNRLSEGDFVSGDLWGSFGWPILVAVLSEAVGAVAIWRLVIYFNWKMEGLVIQSINRTVFDHLMQLGASFHANHFGGSLVSQTQKLAGAYVRLTDTTLFQTLGLLWALLFTVVILIGRAPLFVALLVMFVVLYLVCTVLITRKVRQLNADEAELSNKQTGNLADSITNVMAVKSFAAEDVESRRFGAATEKTRQASLRLMRAVLKREVVFSSTTTTINAVAIVLATASVVLWGANIGTVFLVLSYTTDVLVRLWEFSTQTLRQYYRAFGDSQAMIEILAIEPEVQDLAKPEKSRINQGAINFDNMSFTHPDSRENESLFTNLNLSIKPSEKIGLVGPSGSGKTSLTRLLLRFKDLDGGHIKIDGQDISKIRQQDLRRSIAYVPQEPLLFHRSIRENIAYGKPDATDQEVREAAKKAHAAEFIDKLPQGYETLVGERGVKLSGGQRQRIAIARAILKDAPILVLDEATSALDSESEKLIQDALWKLMQGRTAIVIAHRLSTIQKMDRIAVLDNGEITEQGNHADLLKQKGTYAKLWTHQSGGFIE